MNAESLWFTQSAVSAQAFLPPGDNVAGLLGMAVIGGQALACGPAGPVPLQSVATPLLGTDALQVESWGVSAACRQGTFQDVRYAASANLLFGVVQLDEADVATSAGDAPALQQIAERAYRQIFALLAQEACPYLWRVWNYVPDINRIDQGLERYRQFNIGRHQAFCAFERPVDASPAACALGVAAGPLSIAFLAARTPARQIENPRQVSAFVYPAEYGPRSPTFTRAALARAGEQSILLISGTASIVGHQTMHQGDVAEQTRESMRNISVLLAEANRLAGASLFALDGLVYRVYIRHADDLDLVRQTLAGIIGSSAVLTFVQADICRADLLVEIEAHGFHLPG
ncbi:MULTISPECIES: hypothetical protein [unclassified Paludibacterium]|uniref:chorismate transformation enzyme, FkbO/Hyg5 family n=1 Tax=unclassified Paludibacterium TaxID=2618429 RepID=UPI00207B3F09|nr:hypothetical protein [Paludibacterium sp. B53371]BEV73831.1 pteridine-dependent deoxygenase [Paludibacterium sp. THUN1379]